MSSQSTAIMEPPADAAPANVRWGRDDGVPDGMPETTSGTRPEPPASQEDPQGKPASPEELTEELTEEPTEELTEEPPELLASLEEQTLWTIHSSGFSATTDAYAIGPEDRNGIRTIWFVSMFGAQVAVRAIAATMLNANPKPVQLTPGAEGLVLSHGLLQCQVSYGTIGTWTSRTVKMADGMGYHNMTFTRIGEYEHDRQDFLLIMLDGQDEAEQHRRYLDKRISVPIHGSWSKWLWERAMTNQEVEELECIGIRAWHCRPAIRDLENDISSAILSGELRIA